MVYDLNGNDLIDRFSENMQIDYEFDSASDANYTVMRIFRTRTDGAKQYPFVYAPNGSGAGTMSALQMNLQKNFPVAINAGVFYTSGADNGKPNGIVIQNGIAVKDAATSAPHYPLTIDSSGNLSYCAPDASASSLITNGIISAVNGWAPIIIDYDDATIILPDAYDDQSNAQRQIIGQFGNGDYAIITCEGRDYDHSDGWTMNEARTICKKLGLKFAYNLDGGGSTESVIGKKQINTIYEGTYGRVVPTFIVFNGTDSFGA